MGGLQTKPLTTLPGSEFLDGDGRNAVTPKFGGLGGFGV